MQPHTLHADAPYHTAEDPRFLQVPAREVPLMSSGQATGLMHCPYTTLPVHMRLLAPLVCVS
jgi:hypothetical protein